MKKLNLLLIFTFITSFLFASEIDGIWMMRAGDQNFGPVEIKGNTGTIKMHPNSTDKITIISIKPTQGGYFEVKFERTGAFNQVFVGHLTPGKKFMAGYFYNKNKPGLKAPWYAEFLIKMKN